MPQCPVMKIIGEIRGGFYEGETGFSGGNVIRLGGSDMEFVSDDMSFYIMKRKLAIARLELNPSESQCRSLGVSSITRKQLYNHLVDTAMNKRHLYDQFSRLVDYISDMEQYICVRVKIAGSRGSQVNVSLPTVVIPEFVCSMLLYDVSVLRNTANTIIEYINALNVNSILSDPVTKVILNVPDCDVDLSYIDDTIIPGGSTLEQIKSFLSDEMKIAEKLQEVEKYHCVVINHMNKVYKKCKKIIGGLVV